MRRVLIVEDGTVSRRALAEQVEQWGMVAVEVANAEQALAEVAKLPAVAVALLLLLIPPLLLYDRLQRRTLEGVD